MAHLCGVLCPVEFMCTCFCAVEIHLIQWPLQGRLMHSFLSPCKWSQSWSRVELGAGCSSACSFSFRAPWSCDHSVITVPSFHGLLKKHQLQKYSMYWHVISVMEGLALAPFLGPVLLIVLGHLSLDVHFQVTEVRLLRCDATGYRSGWPVEQGRTRHC